MAKRGCCQGFDGVKGELTAKRIKNWFKNVVESDWRKVHIEKIRYTLIHRTLSYGENSFHQTFISAFGMKESVKKRKMDGRIKSTKKSLPGGAVEALALPEHFDPKDIVVNVMDDGDLGFMEVYVLTCKKCHMAETGFLKSFLITYKKFLPDNPKLADLMDNWDQIIEKHPGEMKHIDVLGCILPHQPDFYASPNENKYINRPVEHTKSKCHQWTGVTPVVAPIVEPLTIDIDVTQATGQSSSASSSMSSPPLASPPLVSPPQASQVSLTSPNPSGKRKHHSAFFSPTSVKKQKLLTVGLDGTVTAEKCIQVKNTKTSSDSTITIKHGKRLNFKPINQLLDPAVSLFQDPTSSEERLAQNSCYSFVLSGCSKEVSNNTTIEFYEKHVAHNRISHQEHIGHIEIDNKVLPKPVRAQLDRNNIKYVHAALVESYKHLSTSSVNKTLYKPFLNDCHFSIFCDGIQKFGLELNGSYARTADSELQVTNAPISLHSIKGGSLD